MELLKHIGTKYDKYNIVFYIVTACLVTYSFLPSYRSTIDLPQIAVIDMIYGFLFLPGFISHLKRVATPIIIYAITYFLVALPGNVKLGLVHPFMTLFICVFPLMMAAGILKRNNSKDLTLTYFISIYFLFVIIISTIEAIQVDSSVMRYLTSSHQDTTYEDELIRNNVGGFAIAYGVGGLFIVLVGCFRTFKLKYSYKLICLVLIAVCGYLVALAQFTTLLILVLTILGYQIWITTKSVFSKILVVIVGITLLLYSEDIMLWLIKLYEGNATSQHLKELYDVLFEEQEYNYSRRGLLSDAIDLFATSPIWGCNMTNPNNLLIANSSHSTILGIACKTGIIGLISFILAYWYAFKPIFNYFEKKVRKQVLVPMVIFFIVLSYINPTDSDVFNYTFGFLATMTLLIIANKNGLKQ